MMEYLHVNDVNETTIKILMKPQDKKASHNLVLIHTSMTSQHGPMQVAPTPNSQIHFDCCSRRNFRLQSFDRSTAIYLLHIRRY